MTPLSAPRETFTRPEKQRAIGAVIGAAVGDALGAPFEFGRPGDYRARFPEPVIGGTGEMIGGGAFAWAPGEFTDDTQMALVMAESVLASGGYDPDSVWAGWRAWAATAADVGSTTRQSLGSPDWRDVARDRGYGAGNGALMRSFVLANALLDAPDEVVRDVVVHQGALTHPDPAAGWGAWIAVEMIRAAIRGRDPLAGLDALVSSLPDEVRHGFAPVLGEGWNPDESASSNGTVWGCLAQAVWALRTTTSFEGAIVAAISLGHDTDTVACVTGALAGARYGVQAIPSRWSTYVHGSIDTVTGRHHYRVADLQSVAIRLLGATEPADPLPESPAGPREVEPGLHAADLLGASGVPTDWAVVSLCRTGDRFRGHPTRRQVFLVDQPGDHNIGLDGAVADAVASVDAFLAEGRTVVVHCHGGRSRTGLVLKAWKMRRDGISERQAHEWLAERWPRYDDHNPTFVEFLAGDW